MTAVIMASSVLCAGGRGAQQLWATVRAGISCIKSSPFVNRSAEPIQMGLVPEIALAPLPPELQAQSLPSGARRMLQLAGSALAALGGKARSGPITVYIGLPQLEASSSSWLPEFLAYLSLSAGVPIDLASSRMFPLGRASALLAMEAALTTLRQNRGAIIAVGGVDSFLDLKRVAELDAERRILCPSVMDGFIPGEGAAFSVICDSEALPHNTPHSGAKVDAAATVMDAGNRYGPAPALGEGLALAIDRLRAATSGTQVSVATTFAGFNGENFEAKLWGVARLRHTDFFSASMVMQHPADCIGDAGAATGAILTALASFALSERQREGPSLIWAASDHDLRGCSLLSI
jgi:3-oxoacyl-[acyl-carrier-protein] synthase-1